MMLVIEWNTENRPGLWGNFVPFKVSRERQLPETEMIPGQSSAGNGKDHGKVKCRERRSSREFS